MLHFTTCPDPDRSLRNQVELERNQEALYQRFLKGTEPITYRDIELKIELARREEEVDREE